MSLAALSISSLGSTNGLDDVMDDVDFDQTADLYQRLNDLEKMTMSFLNERPIRLNNQHDTFSDIDKGSTQQFELSVSDFLHEEVLCLSIVSIPDCVNDETSYLLDVGPKVAMEHQPMEIIFKWVSSINQQDGIAFSDTNEISFTPALHNGEYTFTLNAARGMIPGSYVLSVTNKGKSTQSLRIHYNIQSSVRAIPIRASQKLIGSTTANEFAYYRFALANPKHLITIRTKPIFDDRGPIGDPDLYVTNRFEGLVGVTKENFSWKSTNVGPDRIDIHPVDIDTGRGSIYIIGILGYKERNEFELCVEVSEPKTIHSLNVGDILDITIQTNYNRYFSIQIPPQSKSQLYVKVTPVSDVNSTSTSSQVVMRSSGGSGGDVILDKSTLESLGKSYGRCVYATDGLASHGVLSTSIWSDTSTDTCSNHSIPPMPDIIRAQVGNRNTAGDDLMTLAASRTLPPSLCLTRGVFPVAYLSSNCMYPNREDFTWRGSGADGSILILFEADEWKYTAGCCYLTLSGLSVVTAAENVSGPRVTSTTDTMATSISDTSSPIQPPLPPSQITCRISVVERSDIEYLSTETTGRYEVFQSVFRDIDGSTVSQKERSQVGRDDTALTYGEAEYISFVDILVAAGANHGDHFFDLGCGAGKALIAAAISGINFSRCVGIELLPGLCSCTRAAITKLKEVLSTSVTTAPPPKDEEIRRKINYSPMDVREGDILSVDWSSGDIVYASSICFSETLMQAVLEKSKLLKMGAKFITLKLPVGYESWFEVESQSWYKMTWGRILVYILKRTNQSL